MAMQTGFITVFFICLIYLFFVFDKSKWIERGHVAIFITMSVLFIALGVSERQFRFFVCTGDLVFHSSSMLANSHE